MSKPPACFICKSNIYCSIVYNICSISVKYAILLCVFNAIQLLRITIYVFNYEHFLQMVLKCYFYN